MILGSIGFMIGTGGSALVSKTIGEGNKEKANRYFSMLLYVVTIWQNKSPLSSHVRGTI